MKKSLTIFLLLVTCAPVASHAMLFRRLGTSAKLPSALNTVAKRYLDGNAEYIQRVQKENDKHTILACFSASVDAPKLFAVTVSYNSELAQALEQKLKSEKLGNFATVATHLLANPTLIDELKKENFDSVNKFTYILAQANEAARQEKNSAMMWLLSPLGMLGSAVTYLYLRDSEHREQIASWMERLNPFTPDNLTKEK